MEQIFTSLLFIFLGLLLLGSGSALLGNSLMKGAVSRSSLSVSLAESTPINQNDLEIDTSDNSETAINKNNTASLQRAEIPGRLPAAHIGQKPPNISDNALTTEVSGQSIQTHGQDGITRLASRGPP